MKQFFSLFLGILIVFSSMGFSLSKHYCQGELKETALFVKAKACHEVEKASCHKHPTGLAQENCCNDEQDYIKGIDLETSLLIKVCAPDLPAVINKPLSFFTKSIFNKELIRFSNSPPPLIVKDIIIFVQSFLL